MGDLLLIRHAESEANAAGLWQGKGESELTDHGREQAEALAARLAGRVHGVVSSPLRRAMATASRLAPQPAVAEGLAEIDLGAWDGLTFEQVVAAHGADLEALRNGEDVAFGGSGETFSEFSRRVWAVIDELFDRLGEAETVAAVTHGGVLDAVMARLVGRRPRSRPYALPSNTSLTRLVRRRGRVRLSGYNDVSHLALRAHWVEEKVAEGVRVVALIRHGRTQANAEGRIQGQRCWGLDAEGERQSELLASRYGRFDLVYTSSLERATATALWLAPTLVEIPGLEEMGFGRWEGRTAEDARREWPELFHRIYELREDLPRGETGETWAEMQARVWAAIEALDPEAASPVPVVTHGGPIRAVVGSLAGGGWEEAGSIDAPENTSVTHLVETEGGPVLGDFAVAGHLETL